MYSFGVTDIGMKRSSNQDNFKIKKYECGVLLAVVCDGMGGVNGGQIASAIAVKEFVAKVDELFDVIRYGEAFPGEYDIADALLEGVYSANLNVRNKAGEKGELEGMGTTLVASLVVGEKIYTINVGDSRMYISDSDKIVQITHDHSYVQYLVDIGKMDKKDAEMSKNKNIITRAIGTEDDIEPDIYLTEINNEKKNSDRIHIVLCSDGLTNHVSADEIFEEIENDDEGVDVDTTEKIASGLVKAANMKGGNDNITVVVIAV